MKLALIADTFPPLKTSGATQLFDLAVEISNQGHDLTVFIPTSNINEHYVVQKIENFSLVYIKVWKFKDINFLRRGLAELCMPYLMLHSLRKTNYLSAKWDGLVWYSPSIFFGAFIKYLKKQSKCRTYLILRDLFPDWLVDLGVLHKGFLYSFLKIIENQQYKIADIIGVQTSSNLQYFKELNSLLDSKNVYQTVRRVEVLPNWLGELAKTKASISISGSRLSGRKIFIYTGNIGISQDVLIFLQLAKLMSGRNDVGFVFIGRGSQLKELMQFVDKEQMTNVQFFDEVPSAELASIFSEATVGLLSLDRRHTNDCIPGKFLSYIRSGLPVLAIVNEGNDLISRVNEKGVGVATSNRDLDYIQLMAKELLNNIDKEGAIIAERCVSLAHNMFSPKIATNKILSALNSL